MMKNQELPVQKKIINAVESIPVEYFKWGTYPDHFKIDMPHRHDFSELLFVAKGGGSHEIDFIDYKLEDYSIHYIPQSTIHFINRSPQSIGFTIAFKEYFLEHNEIHRIVSPLSNDAFILNLSEHSFNNIIDLATTVKDQTKVSRSFYKEKCFLLAMELLIHSIANEMKIEAKSKNSWFTDDRLLQEFSQLISLNIHLQTSVKWYANEMNISAKHLSNHISKTTDYTAKIMITNKLLILIKKSLINTNKSIKQISLDFNYSESNLCKLFKKQVGFTMQSYRSDQIVAK